MTAAGQSRHRTRSTEPPVWPPNETRLARRGWTWRELPGLPLRPRSGQKAGGERKVLHRHPVVRAESTVTVKAVVACWCCQHLGTGPGGRRSRGQAAELPPGRCLMKFTRLGDTFRANPSPRSRSGHPGARWAGGTDPPGPLGMDGLHSPPDPEEHPGAGGQLTHPSTVIGSGDPAGRWKPDHPDGNGNPARPPPRARTNGTPSHLEGGPGPARGHEHHQEPRDVEIG